jgi:hypothetical protein
MVPTSDLSQSGHRSRPRTNSQSKDPQCDQRLSIFLIRTNSSPSAEHGALSLIPQGGYTGPIDTMQQTMVHKDLEVVSLTTHFINTLQAYGVVFELVIRRSDAMLAYKANVLDDSTRGPLSSKASSKTSFKLG